MNRMPARALAVTRPIILGLTVLNLLYAVSILCLLCASFFIEGWPWKPLGFDLATMDPRAPLGMRAIMLVGIVGAAIVHTILRRLIAIVDSVRGGEAFILPNAQRLSAIAWSVLAIELLRLAVLAGHRAAPAGSACHHQVRFDTGENGRSIADAVACRAASVRAVRCVHARSTHAHGSRRDHLTWP